MLRGSRHRHEADPPDFKLARLRVHSQGIIATGVLVGATLMGWAGVIGSEAVVAVYSAALGAVAGRNERGLELGSTGNGNGNGIGRHESA